MKLGSVRQPKVVLNLTGPKMAKNVDQSATGQSHALRTRLTLVSWHQNVRNSNPICHPHCPQIPHKHSQPSLYLYGLILTRTKETARHRKGKNMHTA